MNTANITTTLPVHIDSLYDVNLFHCFAFGEKTQDELIWLARIGGRLDVFIDTEKFELLVQLDEGLTETRHLPEPEYWEFNIMEMGILLGVQWSIDQDVFTKERKMRLVPTFPPL